MAIETVEREISGTRYLCTKIPAMRAVKLQNKLGRVLGVGSARIAAAVVSAFMGPGGQISKDVDLSRIDFDKVAEAIGEVFSNLDDRMTEELLREILAATSYVDDKGNPRPLFPATSNTTVFDEHFTGRVVDVWKVAAFSVGVNFGGFFDVFSDLAKRGRRVLEVERASVSPPTTGS